MSAYNLIEAKFVHTVTIGPTTTIVSDRLEICNNTICLRNKVFIRKAPMDEKILTQQLFDMQMQ